MGGVTWWRSIISCRWKPTSPRHCHGKVTKKMEVILSIFKRTMHGNYPNTSLPPPPPPICSLRASISLLEEILCIGGNNSEENQLLPFSWLVTIRKHPRYPLIITRICQKPLSNTAAVTQQETYIYVIGGSQKWPKHQLLLSVFDLKNKTFLRERLPMIFPAPLEPTICSSFRRPLKQKKYMSLVEGNEVKGKISKSTQQLFCPINQKQAAREEEGGKFSFFLLFYLYFYKIKKNQGVIDGCFKPISHRIYAHIWFYGGSDELLFNQLANLWLKNTRRATPMIPIRQEFLIHTLEIKITK